MCYSAMVEQDLKKYGIKKGDLVDVARFRELVHRRSMGENVYIPKAMESNFVDNPGSSDEKEIGKPRHALEVSILSRAGSIIALLVPNIHVQRSPLLGIALIA